MTEWGVDYAGVDGNKPPSAAAFKAAGGTFVSVRGSYCYWDASHKGWVNATDPAFTRDWAMWASAGVVRMPYMFPVLEASQSAAIQVATLKHAIDTAGGLRPGVDMPPCLDIEFPGKGIADTGLDRAGVLAWIRDAVGALRSTFGCPPIIYTSARVWDDHDADCLAAPAAPDLADCPLWLARYPYKTRQPAVLPPPATLLPPPTPSPWVMAAGKWSNRPIAYFPHQYQGDALGAPGFSATTDIDRHCDAKRGDVGPFVAWVQRRLKIAADGDFGGMTENAVKDIQVHRGLPQTGIVDMRTFCAIAWA